MAIAGPTGLNGEIFEDCAVDAHEPLMPLSGRFWALLTLGMRAPQNVFHLRLGDCIGVGCSRASRRIRSKWHWREDGDGASAI